MILHNPRLAAVVPSYNDAHLIRKVIEAMPKDVDRGFVVDDQGKRGQGKRGQAKFLKQGSWIWRRFWRDGCRIDPPGT